MAVQSSSLNVLWNVLQTLSSTRTTSWNVFQNLASTRVVSWNLLQTTNNSLIVSWVVLAPTVICSPLPINNKPAFGRIYVDHLVAGPSKVYWDIDPRFLDPQPYTFQLQVGTTGNPNASDWVNVGASVVNGSYLDDVVQRLFGKQLVTHYRIQLTTPKGTYYSQPTLVTGNLNKRDWNLAREITRKELLRLNQYTAIKGSILKVKRSGTVCSCVDPDTGEVGNSQDPVCYGTGWVGGYYTPMDCVFFDFTPDQRLEDREIQVRGMTDDSIRQIRYIGYPMLYRYDVFVDKGTDERYYVNSIQNLAELRGVPIVVAAQLTPIPFSDIIYTLPVN